MQPSLESLYRRAVALERAATFDPSLDAARDAAWAALEAAESATTTTPATEV